MKLSCWKACCRKHWMKGRVIHLTCCGPRIKDSGPKLPAQWFGLSLILQARWCKFQTLQNTWRWMPVFLFQVGALWNMWNRATWKRSRRSQNFRIQPKPFGNTLTSSLGGRLFVVFTVFCRVKKWTPAQSSGLLMQLIFGWTALSGATDRGVDVGREPKIWKNPTKTMVLLLIFDDPNHIHLKRCLITTKVTFQELREKGFLEIQRRDFNSFDCGWRLHPLLLLWRLWNGLPPARSSGFRKKMRFGVGLPQSPPKKGFGISIPGSNLLKMSLWDAKLLHLSQVSLRMAAKVLL